MPNEVPDAYRLGRVLRAEAMADLYEAMHPGLAGRWAVEIYKSPFVDDPPALAAFRRDLEVMAAVRHPHVLQVLQVVVSAEGAPSVVTEWLDGQTLDERLAQGGVARREALAILRGVASALEAAHRRDVVHADVRPSNILLAQVEGFDGAHPKLFHFGTSWLRAFRGGPGPGLGADDARYLSPELAQGLVAEVDERSDVFSLAALAHRLFFGTDAFPGDDPRAVLEQIAHGEPAAIPARARGGVALGATLRQGLARRRVDRFGGTLPFLRAVEEALAERDEEEAAPPAAVKVAGPLRATPTPVPAATSLPVATTVAPVERRSNEIAVSDAFFARGDADEPFDDDLDAPRGRWKLPVFLGVTTLAACGIAVLFGWRPGPLAAWLPQASREPWVERLPEGSPGRFVPARSDAGSWSASGATAAAGSPATEPSPAAGATSAGALPSDSRGVAGAAAGVPAGGSDPSHGFPGGAQGMPAGGSDSSRGFPGASAGSPGVAADGVGSSRGFPGASAASRSGSAPPGEPGAASAVGSAALGGAAAGNAGVSSAGAPSPSAANVGTPTATEAPARGTAPGATEGTPSSAGNATGRAPAHASGRHDVESGRRRRPGSAPARHNWVWSDREGRLIPAAPDDPRLTGALPMEAPSTPGAPAATSVAAPASSSPAAAPASGASPSSPSPTPAVEAPAPRLGPAPTPLQSPSTPSLPELPITPTQSP